MEGLAVGTVVLLDFPFSDLSAQKKRPALVLATADYNDLVTCQITSSRFGAEQHTIFLSEQGFRTGRLPHASYIRYDKLFTISRARVIATLGHLNDDTLSNVLEQVRLLFVPA